MMPYLVETGGPYLEIADDMTHALELAQHALERADDFARRMGWAPFWAEAVSVLLCPKKTFDAWHRDHQVLAEHSQRKLDAGQVRKRINMPPCPAARPGA
jgi:hypothetical protein